MTRRPILLTMSALLVIVGGLSAPASAALAHHGAPQQHRPSFGRALLGRAPTGKGPSASSDDASTDTLYVSNGFNPNGTSQGGNTVTVIDGRRCDASSVARCKGPW